MPVPGSVQEKTTVIHSGGSIGLHKQESGDNLNYIISGEGKAICDSVEIAL